MNKLSVVTVTFNDFEGLRRTAVSLASQLLRPSLQWIVVNGGSAETSRLALSDQGMRPEILINEKDEGLYDAMNKGIDVATGTHLLFLNGGDTFSSNNSANSILSAIEQYPEACLLFSCEICSVNGSPVRTIRPRARPYLWHSIPTTHQAMIFPVTAVGSTRYALNFRVSADYDFAAKVLLRSPVERIDVSITRFYLGGTSTTNLGKSIIEAWTIQRAVVKTSILLRLLSAARRVAAKSAYRTLNFFLK